MLTSGRLGNLLAVVIVGVLVALLVPRWAQGDDNKRLTMEHVFEAVTEAGLLNDFYMQTSMEPVPSGAFILENLVILEFEEPVTFDHIAGDGAGGAFVQLQSGTILLISSEGQAARLGSNLNEALGVTLSLAHWQDALSVMSGLAPDAARESWDKYSAQWGLPDTPENEAELRQIRDILKLPTLEDPFGAFYGNVQLGVGQTVRSPDGDFTMIGR